MLRDVDGDAACIYQLAGCELDAPPGPDVLARLLLKRDAIVWVVGAELRGDAKLKPNGRGGWVIQVRRRLPKQRQLFAIAHEIAEWWLTRIDYRREDREALANALAAALCIPRAAMRIVGSRDFGAVAEATVTTQTCAALRYAEVTGRSLAVVASDHVHVRGDEAVVWPEERVLRGLAKAKALPPDLEVERVQLTDDPSRVVLLVG